MSNFLINHKIKTIKEFDSFDSFDSLINWDDVHTSYLNEGQCSTEKHFWKIIIMYTNSYESISCYPFNPPFKNNQSTLIFWIKQIFHRLTDRLTNQQTFETIEAPVLELKNNNGKFSGPAPPNNLNGIFHYYYFFLTLP